MEIEVRIDTENQGFHEDVIACPECGELQNALIYHSDFGDIKAHTCIVCGFEIDESDWLSTVVI